ncbi:uncharacterized protein LOC127641325 isoform X10 [Xyrauchen texanus]|uniref:uncharacterized protein LOC127641325 isoform X3 n=1 Tax=Xyrauchen texanus TaxID=154827 RepID=UPI002241D98C|nr:uncharacterized protein LOC127641325 isoform X3 [Xyrauchen texanus]XP_051980221.1 uncharacterized protein LOC127641325 isoform X3 [Xyrauchen texanus]XP_051980222.1 uncharacterized protein LOC127641325 isoform X3 [Xyrauchen texanus]XP_051980223.1 uncharacterized protein LOC127641325 isoform X3 [Xyrauchen texanus]XP_051980231.1 uncharacterized protein LOC127641325 isoform X10 [Xyrauchen texanus]
MKILQLQIYLFMWNEVTEALTQIQASSGDNVTLVCNLDIEEIYWYKQNFPDPPVLLLRTYRSTFEGADYENIRFKHKYSLKTNSSLFIKNVTVEELGVYYCVKTATPLKFSSGTKIYITDFVYMNQTDSDDCLQHQTLWNSLTITSVLLNAFLIIAVIGLVKICLDATGRDKNTSNKPQSTTAAQNSNDPQCAEIDLSMQPSGTRTCQDQSIYSLIFYSQQNLYEET